MPGQGTTCEQMQTNARANESKCKQMLTSNVLYRTTLNPEKRLNRVYFIDASRVWTSESLIGWWDSIQRYWTSLTSLHYLSLCIPVMTGRIRTSDSIVWTRFRPQAYSSNVQWKKIYVCVCVKEPMTTPISSSKNFLNRGADAKVPQRRETTLL